MKGLSMIISRPVVSIHGCKKAGIDEDAFLYFNN